jgi:hypothetical protein
VLQQGSLNKCSTPIPQRSNKLKATGEAKMNAAIQLVNHPLIEADGYDKQFDKPVANDKPYEKPVNNISVFELSAEQRLRRAMNYISQLETELRDLREEISRAERSTAHYETLLRNAMVREMELRADLGKEK